MEFYLLNFTGFTEAFSFLFRFTGCLRGSARAIAPLRMGGAALSVLVIVLLIGFSTPVHAAWPFQKKTEETYIAKVGDVSIKLADFEKAVRKLHTTKRVGQALSEETSFEKHSFAKYLDELIDNELMVIECERMGLDKEPAFERVIYNYKLNLFLGELKREEIFEKVEVTEADIKAELESQGISSEQVQEDGAEQAKKADPHAPTSQPWLVAKRKLTKIQNKAREDKFFQELKAQSSIDVKTKALKVFSSTDEKLHTRVVAVVDGEKIFAIDLLRELRGKSQHDIKLLRRTLDNLILHKLLDKTAFSRGYGDLPGIKAAITKFKKKRLLDVFNRRVILPLVKVDEKEVLDYYESNPDEFMTPASYKLRMIFVPDELEIATITSELKRGADFGYLARDRSIDPTKDKGGELGWVSATRLSTDIAGAVARSKDGDIVGPFKMEYGYSVMERLGERLGKLKPLDSVRGDIDRRLGRDKFFVIHKKYIKRLRETVPIKINKKALKKVTIVKPKEG